MDLLEREYQLDGAVNLMAYIAKVCMLFNISLQYHNKLLQRFTKFMSDDTELAMQDLVVFASEWIDPMSFDWAKNLDQATLTRFVHLVYTALCELIGLVDADDCFHKALAVCEQKPESKKFSASQFL